MNSLIINRVSQRDSVKSMIDAGLQTSSEFLWKIYMKCNYTCRQTNKLIKDPASGQYVLKQPERGNRNCVERARAAWIAKAGSMSS